MFESPAPARPRFLRDPWSTSYESAFQIEEAAEQPQEAPPVDLTVETAFWAPVAAPELPRPEAVVFVDGVQNVDARLLAMHEGVHVNAALVSVAAGAFVARPESPLIDPVRTARWLVVADASLEVEPLEVPWGETSVTFRPHSYPGFGYQAVAQAIDSVRRDLETAVAAEMTARGFPLVVMDGRLRIFPGDLTSVVGYAKTLHTRYLPPAEWSTLAALPARHRTPVFRIDQSKPLYSWYLRLQEPWPADYAMAGIVRLETIAEMPAGQAARLADLTASILPDFASRPWQDARAPQNLLPLGALEAGLRRELGDRASLQRAIGDYLHRLELTS
ncbi:MAG TPA: hypothetical protein VII57_09130 [Dehalococcoidia bacterium]